MRIASKILFSSMSEDFGFHDMLFVFSGRRGLHLWVCDL
jgi:DNA primase small subunit